MNQTDFKVRLVETRARRNREIATIAWRLAEGSECRRMFPALNLENEGLRAPKSEAFQSGIPERCLSHSLFQSRADPIDDCSINTDARHQKEVPLLRGTLDRHKANMSSLNLAGGNDVDELLQLARQSEFAAQYIRSAAR